MRLPDGLSLRLSLLLLVCGPSGLRLRLSDGRGLLGLISRIVILRVNRRMENTQGANILHLNKRIKRPLLQRGRAESLTQVMTILVEIDDASIEVYQDPNYRPNYKFVAPWLFLVLSVILNWNLCIEVVSPSFLRENIARVGIKAP